MRGAGRTVCLHSRTRPDPAPDCHPRPAHRPAAYQLIAGERRWRAAQLAGLTTVPVVIKEATPQQSLELALVENIQRADLNPLEEAEAFQALISDFGLSQQESRIGSARAASPWPISCGCSTCPKR